MYQHKHQQSQMGSPSRGFGEGAREIFTATLYRLLEIVLIPSSSSYGISSDRIEGYANAVMCLIALDADR